MTQQGVGAVSEEAADFENEKLETTLAELRGKIRCLHRAVYIMTVLAGLAAAGLGYCTVFLPEFPESFAQFLMNFSVRLFCALGIASIICLFAFAILHLLYRKDLKSKRELWRQHLIDG